MLLLLHISANLSPNHDVRAPRWASILDYFIAIRSLGRFEEQLSTASPCPMDPECIAPAFTLTRGHSSASSSYTWRQLSFSTDNTGTAADSADVVLQGIELFIPSAWGPYWRQVSALVWFIMQKGIFSQEVGSLPLPGWADSVAVRDRNTKKGEQFCLRVLQKGHCRGVVRAHC